MNWNLFNTQKTTTSRTSHSNGYGNGNGNGHRHGNGYGHHHPHHHGQSHGHGQHHHHHHGRQQMQTQRYAPQAQKTADMQMFREQVNNTFIAITQAAKMAQDRKWDESVVNSATDGAMLSLDMFAVSCGEFQKRADHDAVDLAKKTVTDKWNKLQQDDEATYQLTTKYRDFLLAALNGSKNLRYKTYRVASSELDKEAAHKLESDPQALHDTYQKLIRNSQQFDHEQQRLRGDAELAKKLQQEHEREIKEYRNNPQYRQQQGMQGGKKGANGDQGGKANTYSRPNQAEFYFTKSGQSATFERMNAKKEKQEMEEELFGGDSEQKQREPMDAYSQIPADLAYPNNAMILLSNKHKLGKFTTPIPCKVCYPGQAEKGKVWKHIYVRPAFPLDGSQMAYPVKMLCFDTLKVKMCEARHMKNTHGKLGYPSIAELEAQMDVELDDDL